MFFQDESRFGLFTRNGKSLTARGVKPICPFHQIFKTLYLYGAFSPLNGDSFMLELPNCDTLNFQVYLDSFSEQNPDEFKIIVLDNGAFHKGKNLVIPENIALIFLPPYSPELNPAEMIWAQFKRAFSNLLCETLNDVSNFIDKCIANTSKESIRKTCAFDYVFQELDWSIK